jgi:transcriptional regulator with XRE-family HTH domain
MAQTTPTFSQQLRRAVLDSGLSRYRIAKDIGLNQSTLSRFVNGAWLGKETMDRLAALLGLVVITDPARGHVRC